MRELQELDRLEGTELTWDGGSISREPEPHALRAVWNVAIGI